MTRSTKLRRVLRRPADHGRAGEDDEIRRAYRLAGARVSEAARADKDPVGEVRFPVRETGLPRGAQKGPA